MNREEPEDEIDSYFPESIATFITLLKNAFDEIHAEVIKKIKDKGQYFSNHHDYPKIRFADSGFPLFSETGFFDNSGRKNYTQTIRSSGLIGLFMLDREKHKFPEEDKLIDFLKGDPLGDKFKSPYSGEVSEFEIEAMITQAVESYFQRFGTGPLDEALRDKLLRKVFSGAVFNQHDLRIIVPITLTHFDIDRYKLNDTAYVTRIPRSIQLSRARMDMRGSGAVKTVVGAATHAFVATGWNIEALSRAQVRQSLNNPSKNVLEEADLFFAALRGATGAKTGYAQVVFMPKNGVVDMYCDLPTTHGATYRRYPAEFDEYGWAHDDQSRVTVEQMADVKRLYNLILSRPEDRVRIALKRLNTCMSRDDAADAVLDATIALEVLLGDAENLAISYKIRMRAGALAAYRGNRSSTEVASEVKNIYAVRSQIVHGMSTTKKQKSVVPEEERYVPERDAAINVLRYIIDILLENPRFLNPSKIDQELLLGDVAAEQEPDFFEGQLRSK